MVIDEIINSIRLGLDFIKIERMNCLLTDVFIILYFMFLCDRESNLEEKFLNEWSLTMILIYVMLVHS